MIWNSPDGLLELHLNDGWNPVAPDDIFRSFVGDLTTSNAGELVAGSCHSFPSGGLFGARKVTMEVFKKVSSEPDLRTPHARLFEIELDIKLNGREKQILSGINVDASPPYIVYKDCSHFKVLARLIVLFNIPNGHFLVCVTSIGNDIQIVAAALANIIESKINIDSRSSLEMPRSQG